MNREGVLLSSPDSNKDRIYQIPILPRGGSDSPRRASDARALRLLSSNLCKGHIALGQTTSPPLDYQPRHLILASYERDRMELARAINVLQPGLAGDELIAIDMAQPQGVMPCRFRTSDEEVLPWHKLVVVFEDQSHPAVPLIPVHALQVGNVKAERDFRMIRVVLFDGVLESLFFRLFLWSP